MKKTQVVILIAIAVAFFHVFFGKAWGKTIFASAQDSRILFEKLVSKGFSQAEINNVFVDERVALEFDILKRGKKRDYADVFYNESIERGKKCVASNKEFLKKVEEIFEVPKEILVSIFRVETNLGLNKGKYLVTNSLFTLWFVKSRRSEYFGDELVKWLFICKSQKYDYFSIKGSTAGAHGLMQFMPTSFLEFAIDGNGDGKIDLFVFEDAMASAANYLRGKGWRNGSQENNRMVILRYNSDEEYRDTVIKYARKIRI